jgi:hypothetical protein
MVFDGVVKDVKPWHSEYNIEFIACARSPVAPGVWSKDLAVRQTSEPPDTADWYVAVPPHSEPFRTR